MQLETHASAPTYDSHPDRGCVLHPSCLACPRAVCVDDLSGTEKQELFWEAARERQAEIRAASVAGASAESIRARYGISVAYVYRILRGETGRQEVAS